MIWTGTDWGRIGDESTWREGIEHPFPYAYTLDPSWCKFVTSAIHWADRQSILRPRGPGDLPNRGRRYYISRLATVGRSPGVGSILATVYGYDKIQQMIRQLGNGTTRRVLYVLANVGNADTSVRFIYSRGLEGISKDRSAASGWERTLTTFPPTGRPVAPVWLDQEETNLVMKARSLAAIEIGKK